MKKTGLLSAILIFGLTACKYASSIPTPAPATQTKAQGTSPFTSQPTATIASLQTPVQSPDRVAAIIELSRPASMAAGDRYLWVITGGSVVRFDPKTDQVVGKPIPAEAQFESDIAFGEAALWVTRIGSGDLGAPNDTDAVVHIDPDSGETLATIKVSRGPVSLALTPGIAWVVNFGMSGDGVTRIDAKTYQIIGEPIQTGRAPISLAVGDGSVWVANHDAHSVTRIDPNTGQVVANITVPSEPHRIAFGEGAVWVANWHDNSVSRIDPKTNQLASDPINIGHPAGNIAAGLGSVWVTSDYRVNGDAKDVVVVRIDPQTNQVVETIPVGGHPIDVAVTGEAVWVSVQGPGMVLRINP